MSAFDDLAAIEKPEEATVTDLKKMLRKLTKDELVSVVITFSAHPAVFRSVFETQARVARLAAERLAMSKAQEEAAASGWVQQL